MVEKVLHLLIPHEKNNHKPYLTRHPGLAMILIFTLTLQTSFNVFFSTRPMILGFATSIYQQELINLTNQQRQSAGLPVLRHNPTLDEAARLKALDMFENDYWAHVSPDGVDPWYWFGVVGYSYNSAGENLARDFDTSSGVVNAWMASPSHRSNILYENFTEIGIAVVNGNLNGEDTTLVVQLFATPAPKPELVVAPTEPPAPPTSIPTPPPQLAESTVPTATTPPTPIPTAQPSPNPSPTIFLTATPPPSTNLAFVDTKGTTLGPVGSQTTTPPNQTAVTLAVISSLESMSINRIFTIVLLLSLIILFLSDSAILWHKGIKRENAHRIVHVGVMFITLLGVILGANGTIL